MQNVANNVSLQINKQKTMWKAENTCTSCKQMWKQAKVFLCDCGFLQ